MFLQLRTAPRKSPYSRARSSRRFPTVHSRPKERLSRPALRHRCYGPTTSCPKPSHCVRNAGTHTHTHTHTQTRARTGSQETPTSHPSPVRTHYTQSNTNSDNHRVNHNTRLPRTLTKLISKLPLTTDKLV